MMRIKCVAVLVLAAFFFSGCAKPAGPTASDGKRRKIGISIPTAGHGWLAGAAYWAEQAKAAHPEIDWIYQQSATPEAQITDVESMLSRHIDGLVILPHSGATLTAVAKEAHDKGVFIINVDRGFTEPVADIFLEGDNKAFGRKSAEYVVDRMGGKGNLVIIRGMESTTVDQDRFNSAMEVFNAHGIKPLGTEEGGWDKATALKKMETMLQQYPHIDAVWCQDDDMALGVMQAITEAHREKEMWVLGGAGMKEMVKKVMDGDPMVPADITYPPSMVGAAVHIAASTLRDGKLKELAPMMPHHLTLDVELITPKNAKDFYFPTRRIDFMNADPDLLELLRTLEQRLLDTAVRTNRAAVDELLHDDFFEFGSSGRSFDKQAIIKSLSDELPIVREMTGFTAALLSPGVAVVTYHVVSGLGSSPKRRTNRSSVWVEVDGKWKMRFHQGTVAARTINS